MQEQFDSLARDLARGDVSRRRFLRLLGGLGGAAVLAAVGIRPASALEGDPLLTSGHTRSELEALARNSPSTQATCARTDLDETCGPLTFCSTTCPEGILGTATCVLPAYNRGRPRCAAVIACAEATECGSDADCGQREFCARTCCPGGVGICVPICS
jgi:hypothetical protein